MQQLTSDMVSKYRPKMNEFCRSEWTRSIDIPEYEDLQKKKTRCAVIGRISGKNPLFIDEETKYYCVNSQEDIDTIIKVWEGLDKMFSDVTWYYIKLEDIDEEDSTTIKIVQK